MSLFLISSISALNNCSEEMYKSQIPCKLTTLNMGCSSNVAIMDLSNGFIRTYKIEKEDIGCSSNCSYYFYFNLTDINKHYSINTCNFKFTLLSVFSDPVVTHGGSSIKLYDINLSYDKFYYNYSNSVIVNALDSENNLIDLSSISVQSDSNITQESFRLNQGVYEIKINVLEKGIKEINLTITANDKGKQVTKDIKVKVSEKGLSLNLEKTMSKIDNWVSKNKILFWVIIISIIVLLLVITLLNSKKKD
jgi:hypothetical protein